MFCYSPAPCEIRLRFKSHLWVARFRNYSVRMEFWNNI
jgi:hypothetical protein